MELGLSPPDVLEPLFSEVAEGKLCPFLSPIRGYIKIAWWVFTHIIGVLLHTFSSPPPSPALSHQCRAGHFPQGCLGGRAGGEILPSGLGALSEEGEQRQN